MSAGAFDAVGVGLWTMQSTATAPADPTGLYEWFAEDAALAERLGFRSIWSAEHRAWYDGWCPALVHAQAFAAARTERVRFGHAILLVPQHDPIRLARALATLDRLSGGRVDVGAGLGHRDAEFDMVGLRRDRRGRTMDAALDALAAVWAGEHGDAPPVQRPGPPVLIGGMAPQAIARAASRGHGLMLPQTLRPHELRAIVDGYRAQAERPGTVGALRDVWVEADPARAERFRRRSDAHFREEAGSWWVLKGQVGFSQPEQMDRQLVRIFDTEVVGSPEQVAEGLNALYAAGAELLVLRVNFDFVERAELREQLHALAEEVVPMLEPAVARTA
jgi:alkanesulfonate monooxygenase SsuD/methylene tetrahydromethanopterin reductase-like flavin-dependent oxidoreductase (luciferase family)